MISYSNSLGDKYTKKDKIKTLVQPSLSRDKIEMLIVIQYAQFMTILQYLTGYPEALKQQVNVLIERDELGKFLLKRYPAPHGYTTNKSLYQYATLIKNEYIRNSSPLSKVCYDNKIHIIKHALGMHTSVSRIQGNKLKAKSEIRISNVFKLASEPLLKMIVVHELAHLKEKSHNKDFYQLCCYMEPEYHQLEFDARLYLTYLENFGPLY